GFYSSHDGGKTWTSPEGSPARDPGADPTDMRDPAYMRNLTNVAIDPQDPERIFLSGDWRPFLSEDGGRTWTERVRGADISCITDIRFHGGRTYATAMDEGTFVRENDAKGWTQLWPLKYDPVFSGHYWRVGFATIDGVDRIVTTCSPWSNGPNF